MSGRRPALHTWLVTDTDREANAEFLRIMSTSTQRMLAGEERPYDVGMRLLGDLGPVLTTADYAGAAYSVWGFLTDGIDGPETYARGLTPGQIEDLMRQAAAEWLALEPSQNELEHYFARWSDWPDSVASTSE
jgi:hypothetical protein